MVWWLAAAAAVIGWLPRTVSAQSTIAAIAQGDVIQIEPTSGTFMCGSTRCSSDGDPAEPYRLMYTGTSDSTHRYFVMLDNYCAWRSASCSGGWAMTFWNGTSCSSGGFPTFDCTIGSTTGYCTDIGGSRKTYNFLNQLENFYNSIPATIGGVAKATAIPSRSFDMLPIYTQNNSSTPVKETCHITSNSTPYGNIGTTFDGGACTMTSRVSLLSYEEWQGGMVAPAIYPSAGTTGGAFCQARFGVACSNGNQWFVNTSSTFKRPFRPWLRTAESRQGKERAFEIVFSGPSLGHDAVCTRKGILPSLYLQSSIGIVAGAGTYDDPYELGVANTVPTITIANPAGNPWRSNVSGYTNITVSGNVTDPDNQTQAIQYSIDGGAWTAGQNLAAGTGTRAYSFSVNVGALTEGNHNVKTRTYDGTAYSTETGTLSFRIDKTNPSFTLSPTPTGTSSYLTSTALSVTGSDASSGVAETRYATTNALNSTCTSGGSVGTSITLSAGTNNIYVCVRDNVGNVSTSSSVYNAANVYQVNREATYPSDPTLKNSADPSIGAFASYNTGFNSLVLAGTVSDLDVGQTLTIQYQINSTSGSWSNLTTLTADGSNQSWSGTIALPSGLTDGTHTVYVRVYDGYGYSANKAVNFVLDTTAPSNIASLVGGVLCTGIPTIYCTPPTGIDLSTSSDSAAGIGAYRTQWETAFAAGDVSPAWVTGTPPSNLTTTSHTTSGQTHTLYYQTKDKVGNVSAVESISYYVNDIPEIVLNGASHNHVVTLYTPLVLNGTFTDLDLSQTVTVKVTIDGTDYVSKTYSTGSTVFWEIIIPFSSLQGLSSSQLANLPLIVTDLAGASSSTYYTGQISVSSSTSSEIYLSVIKNIPFALTIGKVGAFNITFGTNQGITVFYNSADEIIVAGSLTSPISIPFGVTTLVFTVLEEPSFEVEGVEFR